MLLQQVDSLVVAVVEGDVHRRLPVRAGELRVRAVSQEQRDEVDSHEAVALQGPIAPALAPGQVTRWITTAPSRCGLHAT